MPSILLDESVPRGVAKIFTSTRWRIAYGPDMGLAGVDDTIVLRAAEAFDVLVTCDQNLVMQNKIESLPFGIVVICTNNWQTILGNHELVVSECGRVQPGTFRKMLKGAHTTRYGRRPQRRDPP